MINRTFWAVTGALGVVAVTAGAVAADTGARASGTEPGAVESTVGSPAGISSETETAATADPGAVNVDGFTERGASAATAATAGTAATAASPASPVSAATAATAATAPSAASAA